MRPRPTDLGLLLVGLAATGLAATEFAATGLAAAGFIVAEVKAEIFDLTFIILVR